MQTKVTGKKALQAAIIISSVAMSSSYASNWDELPEDVQQTSYKEGHIGTGVGAATGAAVGGPPGLVLGALIGKFIGRDQGMQKSMDAREVQLQQIQSRLDNSQDIITSLKQRGETASMQVASVADLPIQPIPNMAKIIQQGIAFSVHFRTDSDQIEQHIDDQCRSFAALARLFPKLVVNLKGYADPRGASTYNLDLSQRRLESVKQLLIDEGIDPALIQVSAKGEDELLNPAADRDSHSFERRVVISFSQKEERS